MTENDRIIFLKVSSIFTYNVAHNTYKHKYYIFIYIKNVNPRMPKRAEV